MRNKKSDLHGDMQKEVLQVLWDAIAAAEKKRSSVELFKNILTESEQLMIARRLVIARMLLAGVPQNEIRLQLRLSPNTIWKVNRWLMEQIPEYEKALSKIEDETKARATKSRKPSYHHYDPFSFTAIKRKYPMHFLLFNVADEIIERLKK